MIIKLILAGSLLAAIAGCNRAKETESASIQVSTLRCSMCVETITKAVQTLDGVQKVEVDKESKIARVEFVTGKVSRQVIENAIAEAGYDANATKRVENVYEKLPACCQ